MLHRALIGVCGLLPACAPEASPDRGAARAPPSSPSPPRAEASGAPARVGLGVVFDPARIALGDTVAGLRVAARDVRRAADGEWVGTVRFAGRVVVRGQTMRHPDYPDVSAPCFAVDSASAARLPRWAGDVRRAWFCFANPEAARARLGAPDAPREATLTLSAFTVHYARSDVVNTAWLVRADGVRALVPGAPTG